MLYAKRDIYDTDDYGRRYQVVLAGQEIPEHVRHLVKDADTITEPLKGAAADYSGKTKAQLEQLLTERGIEFSTEDKKAELVALLEKADSAE